VSTFGAAQAATVNDNQSTTTTPTEIQLSIEKPSALVPGRVPNSTPSQPESV
jgi:hypothetical protein